MTRPQLDYLVRLVGGLSELGELAKSRGLITLTRSNKRDRENVLLDEVSTADASALIESLRPATPGTRPSIDRGNDEQWGDNGDGEERQFPGRGR